MRKLFSLLLVFFSITIYAQIDDVGSGRALRFDGVDDYVDLGNIYDELTFPFTVSAWVFLDPTTNFPAPIMVSQDNAPIYNGFWFIASPTAFFIEFGDGRGDNLPAFRRGKISYQSNMLGRWNHLCAVVRGQYDISLYMNGYDVGGSLSGDSDQPMASNFPMDVAKLGYFLSNGVTYRFKGDMDEVRLWKRSLSENEIRQAMCKKLQGNETGLIGHWTFDETSGTKVGDKSINKYNGQFVGNPTHVFSGAPIGDQSTFHYTNSWNGNSLSMIAGNDKCTTTNIRGNPEGIHIYSVNNIPSQTNGLDVSVLKEPYFGVFLASTDNDNFYDVAFLRDGGDVCKVFSRNNNSIAVWNSTTLPLKDRLQRDEYINGAANDIPLDIGEDKILCDQASYTLKSGITDPQIVIQWSTGQTGKEITIDQTGNYWISATKACSKSYDTVHVIFEKIPKSITLPADEVLCSFTPKILNPVIDPPNLELVWQDGSSKPTFEVVDFGEYWVVAKNLCGEVRDAVKFSRISVFNDKIPNVITPNGDQYNEYFLLDENLKGLVSLEVFNRWGELVYRSTKYNNDWKGDGISGGVYFYRITGPCLGEKKGSVSVLK